MTVKTKPAKAVQGSMPWETKWGHVYDYKPRRSIEDLPTNATIQELVQVVIQLAMELRETRQDASSAEDGVLGLESRVDDLSTVQENHEGDIRDMRASIRGIETNMVTMKERIDQILLDNTGPTGPQGMTGIQGPPGESGAQTPEFKELQEEMKDMLDKMQELAEAMDELEGKS